MIDKVFHALLWDITVHQLIQFGLCSAAIVGVSLWLCLTTDGAIAESARLVGILASLSCLVVSPCLTWKKLRG